MTVSSHVSHLSPPPGPRLKDGAGDRHPMTPYVDGREREEEVLREEAEESDRSLE